MLLTIAGLVTLGAFVLIDRMRWPARRNDANLGSMSAQWLAEHRASTLP